VRELSAQYASRVNSVMLSPEVEDALAANAPVVALESTIIAHGLPRPDNLVAAKRWENQVREAGATPATVAIIDGVARVGLNATELERIALDDIPKVSVRDIPVVMGLGRSGATTVASTAFLAARAGVRVFATGGLGGVHRGATVTFDESADLPVLAETPITVVSAGVKSILDIGATLERLETYSVPVLGYQTSVFPAFWLRESSYSLEWSVSGPGEVAAIMASRDALGQRSGIIVANPVPSEQQWDPSVHDRILAEALEEADRQGIRGNEVTPFLLAYVLDKSGGESLRVNLDLVTNNVRVATEIAVAWSALTS
jgi:pseudouridine-5'-phosphate glycosidase